MNTYKKTSELQNVWAWRMGDSIFFDLEEEASLIDALGYTKPEKMPRIISFVGGGGKTTSMYQLAQELAEREFNVLVTTTTHIACPQTGNVCIADTAEKILDVEWEGHILTAGKLAIEDAASASGIIRKLTMPEGLENPAVLEKLLEITDFILIEADGAKRCPIKIPADHEPVIIPQTGLVIACAGLSSVGKPLGECCFRFETCGSWLMREKENLIEPEDIALILMDGRGSRKNLDGRYYKIILNQADTDLDLERAKQIICALPGKLQLDTVVTRYKNNL